MVAQLPGDRFTEAECKKLAAELDMPSSNICRYCGEEIKTMCFTMTGSCCEVHDKLRHNPDLYNKKTEFHQHFTLPPRHVAPSTESRNAQSRTDIRDGDPS